MFQSCPHCDMHPGMKNCEVCNDTRIIDTVTGRPPSWTAIKKDTIAVPTVSPYATNTGHGVPGYQGTCSAKTTSMGVPYTTIYKPDKKYVCIYSGCIYKIGDIVDVNLSVRKLTRKEAKEMGVYELWSCANLVVHNPNYFTEYKYVLGSLGVGATSIKLQNNKIYYGRICTQHLERTNTIVYYMEWDNNAKPYHDLGQTDYYHRLVIDCAGYYDLFVNSLEKLQEQLNILAVLPDISVKVQAKTTVESLTEQFHRTMQQSSDKLFISTHYAEKVRQARIKQKLEEGYNVNPVIKYPEKDKNAKFGCQIMLGTRGNDSLAAFLYALYFRNWVNDKCPVFTAEKLDLKDKAGDKIVNESKPQGDTGIAGKPGVVGIRYEEIKDFGIKGGKVFRIVDDKFEGIIVDFGNPDKVCEVYSKPKDKVDPIAFLMGNKDWEVLMLNQEGAAVIWPTGKPPSQADLTCAANINALFKDK